MIDRLHSVEGKGEKDGGKAEREAVGFVCQRGDDLGVAVDVAETRAKREAGGRKGGSETPSQQNQTLTKFLCSDPVEFVRTGYSWERP